MKYRRPNPGDFKQIVALQNKNLISVLTQSEQSDGFLSAAFSEEQFRSMDNDLCVVICTDLENICGYVCASSVEYNKNIPLVAAMLNHFPNITYQEKSLAVYNSFIYGPVCIDKEYRGKNILSALINKMLELLLQKNPQLELLTVLISSENQRSINAHKKLGMEKVGQFEFAGKIFWILVRPIYKTL